MARPAAAAAALALAAGCAQSARPAVLVFSKTAGFRHESIPAAIRALQALAQEEGLAADSTEDAAVFADETLARYGAVVFVDTTGDVLDAGQQAAFERYIRGGRGFMGIHAAADSAYGWPFYGETVGAWFLDHTAIEPGILIVEDANQAATAGLPARWSRTDEWYSFRSNPRSAAHVLVRLDESIDHPLAWCRGRLFYTALGHTIESFSEPLLLQHLRGGLRTVTGLAPCPER